MNTVLRIFALVLLSCVGLWPANAEGVSPHVDSRVTEYCETTSSVICVYSADNNPVVVLFPVGHDIGTWWPRERYIRSGVMVMSLGRYTDVSRLSEPTPISRQSLDVTCRNLDDPHRICVQVGDVTDILVMFPPGTEWEAVTMYMGRVPAALIMPVMADVFRSPPNKKPLPLPGNPEGAVSVNKYKLPLQRAL